MSNKQQFLDEVHKDPHTGSSHTRARARIRHPTQDIFVAEIYSMHFMVRTLMRFSREEEKRCSSHTTRDVTLSVWA